MNIQIVLFFDDGIICSKSKENCERDSLQVKRDLLFAHIVPSAEKSQWEPTKNTTWLGFYWDFEDKYVSVSPERIKRLFKRMFHIRKIAPFFSAKDIAGVVGSLVSMSLVLGDKCIFLGRFLQDLVNYRNLQNIPWSKIHDYSLCTSYEKSIYELEFLIENLKR